MLQPNGMYGASAEFFKGLFPSQHLIYVNDGDSANSLLTYTPSNYVGFLNSLTQDAIGMWYVGFLNRTI